MKTAALLMLLVAASPGYAAAGEPDAQDLERAVGNAATMLAERSDPDSLAAAALLAKVSDATRAEQLAGRASAAAPKRPDLLWLHAQLCHDVQACDRSAIDSRLQALDPDNGAVFIARLYDVDSHTEPRVIDGLFAAAAASKRIDFYWNPLIAHVAPAVLSTKMLPPSQSVAAVIGSASVVVIPIFAGVNGPCRNWMPNEDRRAQCRAIGRALIQGDTAIAQLAGANMTAALWPADSPEALAANETLRTLSYQVSTHGAQAARRLVDANGVTRYLDKLARYRREQDVIVAEIVEAGGSPTPPANWRPGPPQERALAPAAR